MILLFLDFFMLIHGQFSFEPHFWEQLDYEQALLAIDGATYSGRKINIDNFVVEVFRKGFKYLLTSLGGLFDNGRRRNVKSYPHIPN